ncbi:hypothetical protein HRR83_002627 [Exophiala dermatitidis]|uniref:BZIP domain-containing protein n=2 Tax=Exophiala dermatitidis TaxID=5970 RepID=H6BZS7_EXODN|nr:uncharacterized protein HMPREF1120_05180 [Exophiala dermatitidis NIH/UT8656]KAJ4503541.1 hypothetical protein HRR74_009246 [Exophiala dermatitidis]EHY57131.1 hypothetical protein HMPREF1120_05180 [Exophiala dermatitidis NIH/UT8656]KAJ4514541.1 hypothetical protein HRR73_005569 [Exophiala dermatitidis]KAJ4531845.1 hypothetical protein HRR77_009117 [Exophiala dermatitidis]KAJ4537394.1 hypothetical protein HRR76_005403 [Exophiala dermatitidis]
MYLTDDQFTSVRLTQNKTPAHTLIRVRNNQRRHRERRRQYIAFLEEKVDHSEHLLAQARARIAELESNCRYWKYRTAEEHPGEDVIPESLAPTEGQQQLEKMGDETLKTTLWVTDTSRSPDMATTSKSRPSWAATNSTVADGSFTPIVSPPEPSPAFISPTSVHLFQIPEPSLMPQHKTEMDKESISALKGGTISGQSEDASQGPLGPESDCKTYPPLQDESTVPCSHASILIAQQNARGMDEDAIRCWLEKGFRRGKHQDEGCRVETSLLFALLDFISTF